MRRSMGSVVSLEDKQRSSGSARAGSDLSAHGSITPLPSRRAQRPTYFTKQELQALLQLYASRVSTGEWRDYALDFRPGTASFSVFRSSYERPVHVVVKHHVHGARKGIWFEALSGPRRLKRGATVSEAIAALALQAVN